MAQISKLAVVTGAGQGLGRGIARRLAEAGYELALLDRQDCAETAELITDDGGMVHSYLVDVADEADVVSAFEEIDARQGAPTALVNAAGIFLDAPFLETSAA